jgi:flagellar assembly factor FliW
MIVRHSHGFLDLISFFGLTAKSVARFSRPLKNKTENLIAPIILNNDIVSVT